MASKFDKLLAKFQANAWPAMVNDLADDLGVTPGSLRDLGIGYVPAVEFKSGINTAGWWAFPERDHKGEVVGLSLRAKDGRKVMYPGSKHGLFYRLNPDHKLGEPAYRKGKDNWVRTMDSGRVCPVCEKPDGCLIAGDDADDPKAVICIRERSSKPMELGWLHILKPEGNVSSGDHDPLGKTSDPVVVVEGASDAAAALGLGLLAVGRPSNIGGMGEVKSLVQGRDLLIVGENDSRWNADRGTYDTPGLDGVRTAFDYLRPHCRKVVRLMPPEEHKDLRAWVRAGLTREGLLEASESDGETQAELTHLDSDEPLKVAEKWLLREHSLAGNIILRQYHGDWYRYDNGCYRPVDTVAVIRGGLYKFLENKTVATVTPGGQESMKPYAPARKNIDDIIDSLSRFCPVDARPPFWLDERPGPDPKWLVSFPNGILDAAAYFDYGDDGLIEPTPALFNVNTLPYSWDATATCPTWDKFLESTFEDEKQSLLLQEWFGYNLVPDNSHEKFLLCQGPSRAGKGVALSMLEYILGPDQVAATNFDSLASATGLSQLVGRLAVVLPDAVLPQRVDKSRAMGTILSVTGNDPVTIKKLYRDEYTAHLHARFTVAVNELPTLPDNSRALENRMLVLPFTRSFAGREDPRLKTKLRDEAPGVVLWALEGLRRLRDQREFTIPDGSQAIKEEFRTISSPMEEFVDEVLILDPTGKYETERSRLFDTWSAWCLERGMKSGTAARLLNRLKARSPYVKTETYTHVGESRTVVTGVKLQPWAESKLLGKPP